MGYIHLADVRIRTTKLLTQLQDFDPALVAVDRFDKVFSFGDYLTGRLLWLDTFSDHRYPNILRLKKAEPDNDRRIAVCRLYGTGEETEGGVAVSHANGGNGVKRFYVYGPRKELEGRGDVCIADVGEMPQFEWHI